jgi:type I restriction enzyme S subunit
MPRASWAVLANYRVPVPNGETAALFSRVFCGMVTQQQTLVFQIQTLRRMRDLLLPRLLSGAIDISDPSAGRSLMNESLRESPLEAMAQA